MPITIRSCTDADVDGVVSLIEDRIGAEDAPEARLVLENPAYDRSRWTVAVDGDRVVSTMSTYPMMSRLGISDVAAALIEFVATDREYEGRGLVRAQFEHHQNDLSVRGELLEVMVGITYFYRRLGYEYALPVAPWQEILSDSVPRLPSGWSVRPATELDAETILRLQHDASRAADATISLSKEMWGFLLRSPVYDTVIAEKEGVPHACGRIYWDDGEPTVMDLASSAPAGMQAVLAGVAALSPGKTISNLTRPAAATSLDALGAMTSTGEAYYARVGEPVRLLNQIRPELGRRLAASSLADQKGEGLISLYASSIRFDYQDGDVGEFRAGPPEPGPISKGGSGVAPDRMTSLLVGPLGFTGLADLHPDVNGGTQTELMDALFPPQLVDVQSWVVP